jgi:hypothetical protein
LLAVAANMLSAAAVQSADKKIRKVDFNLYPFWRE